MRPDVTINELNGQLDIVGPSEDGISLLIGSAVAISGNVVLNTLLGPFTSPADAEALGIDAAYDLANTLMLHQHIVDFYDQAPLGTELYVLPVAKTVTMTQMCDKSLTYAKTQLAAKGGVIKLMGVSRIPDGAYVPTYVDQFDGDVFTAVTKAQALVVEEFAAHRPLRVLIEGRDFQGNCSSSADLRSTTGLLANKVGVVMFNDNDVALSNAYRNKYASVGYALGRLAGIPVQRSMGRVKDGARSIVNAGLSNGVAYAALSEPNVVSLHGHGYIFLLKHAGKSGFFFNSDPSASPVTDDYSKISYGRVIDKAARICRAVFLEEINDDIDLDPATGRLGVETLKHYQDAVEKKINTDMTNKGEIVRVSCYVDPTQNVLTTEDIKTRVKIYRKGISESITVDLSFANPLVS